MLFGLMGCLLHRTNFDHVFPKDVDSLHHLANFIAAVAMADFDVGLADGQLLHHIGDGFDGRTIDAPTMKVTKVLTKKPSTVPRIMTFLVRSASA